MHFFMHSYIRGTRAECWSTLTVCTLCVCVCVCVCVCLCLCIRCICGLLKNKTRILVTHQLQHLKVAEQIVVLKEVCAEENNPVELCAALEEAFPMSTVTSFGQICCACHSPAITNSEILSWVCSGRTALLFVSFHEALIQISLKSWFSCLKASEVVKGLKRNF